VTYVTDFKSMTKFSSQPNMKTVGRNHSAKGVHAGGHPETAAAQEGGGEGWRWIGVHMAECSAPKTQPHVLWLYIEHPSSTDITMYFHGNEEDVSQAWQQFAEPLGNVPCWPWSTAATRPTCTPHQRDQHRSGLPATANTLRAPRESMHVLPVASCWSRMAYAPLPVKRGERACPDMYTWTWTLVL
jgi:hypothetical protein